MANKRPEEKKQKKKRGHGGLIILIIIFLLLCLLFLLNGKFGWFGGDGDGSGDGKDSAAEKSEASVTDQAADKDEISITVKGTDYIIDGKTMTLDEVKAELGKYDKEKITVKIIDDSAIEGAFKSLTDALGELEIKYVS